MLTWLAAPALAADVTSVPADGSAAWTCVAEAKAGVDLHWWAETTERGCAGGWCTYDPDPGSCFDWRAISVATSNLDLRAAYKAAGLAVAELQLATWDRKLVGASTLMAEQQEEGDHVAPTFFPQELGIEIRLGETVLLTVAGSTVPDAAFLDPETGDVFVGFPDERLYRVSDITNPHEPIAF